jgi:dihydroneopterin aldolase
MQDEKVRHVRVKIVKLALSEQGESIGITMGRWRK